MLTPKVKRVINPPKELRLISLPCFLSKVAEEFGVVDYIKPALIEAINHNQFGTVSGSSTIMALISMIHTWLCATDGTGSTVRVLLFDYRKAFDLIDHSILVNSFINWVISFPLGRTQIVKLGEDCCSEHHFNQKSILKTLATPRVFTRHFSGLNDVIHVSITAQRHSSNFSLC